MIENFEKIKSQIVDLLEQWEEKNDEYTDIIHHIKKENNQLQMTANDLHKQIENLEKKETEYIGLIECMEKEKSQLQMAVADLHEKLEKGSGETPSDSITMNKPARRWHLFF